ncbi:TPA: hypothetical protein P2I06_001333 [Aeromonas veronii]|nr:hypothetical protein [Aeromonas veronii]
MTGIWRWRFDPVKLADVLDSRLRPELLALDWQRALGLAEGQLSVVDINQAPIPLAFAIVDANRVLFCRDQGRRLTEEARIMSQMECLLYQQTHKDQRC